MMRVDHKSVVFTKTTLNGREFRVIQQGHRFFVDEWLDKYSSWTEHVDGASGSLQEAIDYIKEQH